MTTIQRIVMLLPSIILIFGQCTLYAQGSVREDVSINGEPIFKVTFDNLIKGCGPSQASLYNKTDNRFFTETGQLEKPLNLDQYTYDGVVVFEARKSDSLKITLVNNDATTILSYELKQDNGAQKFGFANNTSPSNSPIFEGVFTYFFEEPELNQNGDPLIQIATFAIQTSYFDKVGNEVSKTIEMNLPFIVTGAVGRIEPRGVTTTPMIPYMVLHDPPGDGSSSTLSTSFETCRTFGTSYLIGGGASVWGEVKLGFESGGFIPIESFVSVRAGLSVDAQTTTQNETQLCISTTKEFSTSDLGENVGSDSDIFIGWGNQLEYGIAESAVYDYSDCTAKIRKTLAFRTTGFAGEFIFTEGGIRNDLQELQQKVADPLIPESQKRTIRAQIDAWQSVLAINERNKAAAKQQPLTKTTQFNGGPRRTETISVSTSETNTIETLVTIDASLAIEVGAEIAGSGASAGAEIRIRSEFGETNAVSQGRTSEISYTLFDDDLGDDFSTAIKTDPMYGTPLFELLSGSRTSCPYEGGYQLDQPLLTASLNCETGKNISISNIPPGNSPVIPLNICNNSDVERTYFLTVDGMSNTNGAEITLAGFGENLSTDGVGFTVPAGSCITANPKLKIARNPGTNLLNYENITVFLRPLCESTVFNEASIKDAIILSARFTNNVNAVPIISVDGKTGGSGQGGVTTCPADITVNAAAGTCTAQVFYTAPAALEGCGISSITRTAGPASGENFPIGTTLVSYIISDIGGNQTICSFNVSVIDNEAPVVMNAPQDQTVNVFPGACGERLFYEINATDNCGISSIERTEGPESGDNFFPGTTRVTHVIRDVNGNTTTTSFSVTVIDNEAPSIQSSPSDTTLFVFPGACGERLFYTPPTAWDNCVVAKTERIEGPESGDNFFPGTTTVTHAFTDNAGNVTLSSFNVTVIDNEAPTSTFCPEDIVVELMPGACTAVVNYAMPEAFDNCVVLSTERTAGLASGTAFPVGTTQVDHVFRDPAGNLGSCSFNVIVLDNAAPEILSCPDSIVVTTLENACNASVSWDVPTAQDNCSQLNIQSNHSPGAVFEVGTDTVQYTFTDASGNATVCAFPVIVLAADESCDMIVSANQQAINQANFQLLPNPAWESVQLNFSMPQAGQLEVHILDLLGRRLVSLQERRRAGDQTINIPLEGIPAGTYLVSVQLSVETSKRLSTGVQRLVIN